MSTPDFITRHFHQDLVYWGTPENDGYGGFVFDDPVEIKGRCEYKVERVLLGNGEETVSQAIVYTDEILDEGGYLYLGTLDDSSLESAPVPEDTANTMRILVRSQSPTLDGRGILYKYYLNMK